MPVDSDLALLFGLPGITGSDGGGGGGPVNVAPVVDLNGAGGGINASGTFTEGDAFTSYLSSATLTDADSDPLVSLTMTCGGADWGTDGLDEQIKFDTWVTDADTDLTDTLVVGSTTFQLAFVAATGILTITKSGGGTFSAEDGQALKRLFQYANNAEPPTTGDRTFTWVANDGTDNSTAAVLTVTVAAAPTNSLDLGGTSGNYAGQFIIGGAAAAVSDTAAIAGDDPTELTITLGGFVDGDDEEVTIGETSYPAATDDTGSASAGATTFDVAFASGVFTITKNGGGAMPKADLETLIDGISTDRAEWPYTPGARTLAFSLDGGAAKTATITTYIAELPRVYVDTTYSLPTGGTTFEPADAAALQTAFDDAVGGDVIILTAGVTYQGNFKIPNYGAGTDWVYVISSELASLPAAGTRVTPAYADYMPKIRPPEGNTSPVLTPWFEAHHYRFVGIEFVTDEETYNLVWCGAGTDDYADAYNLAAQATADAELNNNITFDRCIMRSDSEANRLRVGLCLNGRNMAAVDCWVENCKDGPDANAIHIWNGQGPYKVKNCFLEGSAENLFVGGVIPAISGCEINDLEFQDNTLRKRQSWKGHATWNIKNIFELKNAHRVLFRANTLENCWIDAQNGFAILLTPRDEGGVSDVTIASNVIRYAGQCMTFSGEDYYAETDQTQRIAIEDNVFYDISTDQFTNNKFLLITSPPTVDYGDLHPGRPTKNVRFANNTLLHEDGIGYKAVEIEVSGLIQAENWTFVNNIWTDGKYEWTGFDTGRYTNFDRSNNFVLFDPDQENYAFNLAAFGTNFPGNTSHDGGIETFDWTDPEAGEWTLEATSPGYQAGSDGDDVGPDASTLPTTHTAPVIYVGGTAGNRSAADLDGGGAAAYVTERFADVIAFDRTFASLEIAITGIADGAAEEITVLANTFPSNADDTVTSVVIGDSTVDIDFVTATKTFTVTPTSGTITRDSLRDIMRSVQFEHTSETPTTGNRVFSFTANDGTDDSNTATSTITVNTPPPPSMTDAPNLIFDGNDDHLDFPDFSAAISTEASLAILIKLDAATPALAADSGFGKFSTLTTAQHYPYTDGSLYLAALRSTRLTITPDAGINRATWHWLIVTTEPGANGWKCYQNKTLIHQATGDASVPMTTAANLGSTGLATYWLDGNVAQILVYDRVIDSTEITALVDNETVPTTPLIHYDMSEGTGSPQDQSGNGYHSTWNGTWET